MKNYKIIQTKSDFENIEHDEFPYEKQGENIDEVAEELCEWLGNAWEYDKVDDNQVICTNGFGDEYKIVYIGEYIKPIKLKELLPFLPKYINNIKNGAKANGKVKMQVAVDNSQIIDNQDAIPNDWYDKEIVSIEPIITSASKYGAKATIRITLK